MDADQNLIIDCDECVMRATERAATASSRSSAREPRAPVVIDVAEVGALRLLARRGDGARAAAHHPR